MPYAMKQLGESLKDRAANHQGQGRERQAQREAVMPQPVALHALQQAADGSPEQVDAASTNGRERHFATQIH